MDQLLKDQNKVEGVDKMNAAQMESTVGAVLSFLKSQGVNVDAVQKTIPNANALMQTAETQNAKSDVTTTGGAAGAAVGGMMGKLGGLIAGASPTLAANTTTTTTTTTEAAAAAATPSPKPVDSMPALLQCLGSAGISPQQLESVLPLVAGTLQSKCGVDAYTALGLPPPAAATKSGGGILSGLRGFLGDVRSETTGKE